jgi:helix-turn-helix protein
MTQTETQKEAILEYLLCGLKLTPAVAWMLFGCSKLATRVSELRKDNFPIQKRFVKVKNRYGKDVHVMQYSL